MIHLFLKGGPIMWPLLLTSIIAVTVVVERLFYIWQVHQKRDEEIVEGILSQVEHGNTAGAIRLGSGSDDYVARVLTYALTHHETSYASALLRAANRELKGFSRGVSVLDTIITLAPLLGLLGTVTGMVNAFGLLGAAELGAPTAITGGIAEALIATAFGLGIAITALIPFNYLNAQLEQARHDIEDASCHMELSLARFGLLTPKKVEGEPEKQKEVLEAEPHPV